MSQPPLVSLSGLASVLYSPCSPASTNGLGTALLYVLKDSPDNWFYRTERTAHRINDSGWKEVKAEGVEMHMKKRHFKKILILTHHQRRQPRPERHLWPNFVRMFRRTRMKMTISETLPGGGDSFKS